MLATMLDLSIVKFTHISKFNTILNIFHRATMVARELLIVLLHKLIVIAQIINVILVGLCLTFAK